MAEFYVNTTDVIDKTFQGFKLDHATGKLTVHVIDDDSVVLSLPDDTDNKIIDNDDYKSWFYTSDMVTYEWDAAGATGTSGFGHLLMKIM